VARRFSGELLLICGLVSMIGMIVQTSAPIRCGQMIAVMIVSAIAGKRIRLLPPFFMLTGVIAANVLVPNGRVLLSVGRFGVTLGALENGLLKGALLIAMIYVSRLSVGRGLRLPGTFGSLLLRAFAYFEALTEQWPATTGPVISRVDDMLVRIHQADTTQEQGRSRREADPRKNAIIAGVLLVIGWGPLLLR
jgi:hypothetical protein